MTGRPPRSNAGEQVRMQRRLELLEQVLRRIQKLSDYPGKGKSNFEDLAAARRKINHLASDALKKG